MIPSATKAAAIAAQMRADGFDCSSHDVIVVYRTGYLDGREALASRILQAFDDFGVTVSP